MNETKSPPPPKAKAQIWTQILLPVIVSGIALLVIVILTAVTTSGNFTQSAHFADVAAVVIILPTLFCLLIPLGIVLGLSWLAGKGIKGLPLAALKVQTIVYKVLYAIYKTDRMATKPVIAMKSKSAGISRLFSILTGN